ncbi:hypothetical protein BUALT_Bualt02G0151100 [Buddleja alternifolia]|uniref:Uncharacterized protein n=1 Tax=Buddleja alternifolia TaxID=168488 RepID=A0AAV6Y4L2_9LAMI|nr:hypothetical protein BUALT_Bualt02G0151100 [Buddleja alternifolia]
MVLEIGGLFLLTQQLHHHLLKCTLNLVSDISLAKIWAAIASYLPERTDNDIKNYWNTHLKKKLKKLQGDDPKAEYGNSSNSQSISKGQWERRLQTDIHMAKQALCEALSLDKSSNKNSLFDHSTIAPQTTYASSAENIARLLENWKKKPPNSSSESTDQSTINNPSAGFSSSSPSEGAISTSGNMPQMPLTLLEKWLLDDASAQGQDGEFMDAAFGETADLF